MHRDMGIKLHEMHIRRMFTRLGISLKTRGKGQGKLILNNGLRNMNLLWKLWIELLLK